MRKIQYEKDEKVTGPVSRMERPGAVCWYSGDCILFIDTLADTNLEYLTNTLEALNSRETEYMNYTGH